MALPEFLVLDKADSIQTLVRDQQLWIDLAWLSKFMGGFKDAIYKLESDQALLSDVFFIYRQLDILVKNMLSFSAMLFAPVSFVKDDTFKNMQEEWEVRKPYCYGPWITLAALLDYR